MMTKNQILAKVLYSNKLVTESQIQEYWGKIDSSRDLGALLFAAGILDRETYDAVEKYVRDLAAKMAEQESAKQEPSKQELPKQESAKQESAKQESPRREPSKQESPRKKGAAEKTVPAEEPKIELVGNNPYGESGVSSVQIEKVEGLEQTRIAPVAIPSGTETEEHAKADKENALPDRFEIESGEGSVRIPERLTSDNSLAEILAFVRQKQATDVYLSVSSPLAMRVCGVLGYVFETPLLGSSLSKWLSEAKAGFADGYEPVVGVDFSKSFALAGAGRNRLTVTWNETAPSLAIRVIPAESIPLEKLHLPRFALNFANLPHGLILIAGPSGSGRSTTLCAFGEAILKNRSALMVSIEKPIERLLPNPADGLVVQKEVGLHSHSGVSAIRDAVFAGAGVILFDHLETLDEIWALLQASSAGALVLAVSRGNDIYGLLSRILSAGADRGSELAAALADELQGVIVQHLVPVIDDQGQILAIEAMKMTGSLSNLIRRRELIQLPSAISAAKDLGITLDDSLQNLVEAGYIRGEEAWRRSLNRRRFASYRPGNQERKK